MVDKRPPNYNKQLPGTSSWTAQVTPLSSTQELPLSDDVRGQHGVPASGHYLWRSALAGEARTLDLSTATSPDISAFLQGDRRYGLFIDPKIAMKGFNNGTEAEFFSNPEAVQAKLQSLPPLPLPEPEPAMAENPAAKPKHKKPDFVDRAAQDFKNFFKF